jgi:hypothetical protein
MALEGYFGIRRAAARPADNDDRYDTSIKDAYLPAEWGERLVTTVAVSAAVVVVALIAVLMGSVGP